MGQQNQLQTMKANLPSLAETKEVAFTMVEAGLLPKGVTKEQGYLMALKGRDMGIPPTLALSKIDVIQGKLFLEVTLRAGQAIKVIPGFNYQILEKTDKVCKIKLSRMGWNDHIEIFTIEDAIQSKVAMEPEWEFKNGKNSKVYKDGELQYKMKDGWKKDPKNMLFKRCLGRGIDSIAPDFEDPGIPFLYTENAAQAMSDLTEESSGTIEVDGKTVDTESGEVLEAEVVSEEKKQPEAAPQDTQPQTEEPKEEDPQEEVKSGFEPCVECQRSIGPAVIKYSKKEFGKVLCISCQKKQPKEES